MSDEATGDSLNHSESKFPFAIISSSSLVCKNQNSQKFYWRFRIQHYNSVMVGPFALLCLFLIAVYLYISFVNKSKKGNKNCYKGGIDNETHTGLLPLPEIPFLRTVLWSLLQNGMSMPHILFNIGRKHKVGQIKLWKMRMVYISDFKFGKELFSNAVFCGKNTTETFLEVSQGQYGLANNDGSNWKTQRRLCYNILKQFGFGPNSMETFITTEVESLIQNWRNKTGERFSPNKSFYLPVLNSIWTIVAGDRASDQDSEGHFYSMILRFYSGFIGVAALPDGILTYSKVSLPTIKKIIKWIPIFSGLKLWFSSIEELHSYFRNIIEARKKTLNIHSTPTNLVDAYLQEIHNTTDPDSEMFGWKGEMNLVAVMVDFFLAGGDTTANMLAWAMLHLIRRPDVQEKIQAEVDGVVDANRRPTLNDRASCPYTHAFILEVLRFNPVAATSLPHSTTEDAQIGPYFIEKGTFLALNTIKIQHDPKIWGDPQVFRPERFLSEDKKSVLRIEALCLFSLGPRRCIGEAVARDTLFLFTSAICQQFTLMKDPLLKENMPSLGSHLSFVHSPLTFHMVVKDRLLEKIK